MKYEYYFTVFIPAYNRGNTLERLFRSLENQIYKDFEVIIVDDGSIDNTKSLVDQYISISSYDVRYFYQENQGKPTARNLGVEKAKGMLFKTIDSDDIITDDCLLVMKETWESINEKERKHYAGVIGLCADMNNKEIIGDKFPTDRFDSNHVLNSTVYNIKGDKTQCIRTDLMKKNKYPLIEGEKFIAESVVWNRISVNYKFRYVNKVLKYVEYLDDGISKNLIKIRVDNCKSSRLYYQEYVNEVLPSFDVPKRYIIKGYANYIRFSLHCDVNFKEQIKDIYNSIYYVMSLPIGIYLNAEDKKKLRKRVKV